MSKADSIHSTALEEPAPGHENKPERHRDILLFTHFVVREDAQLLYGFGSRTERDVFRDLIRISGVGPKLALSVVSSLTLEALAEAVRSHDVGRLTKVQGVGKKTAERLLMELKDRLGDFKVVARPVSVSADQQAIREAVDAVAAEALTTEELLRAALKQLARLLEVSS